MAPREGLKTALPGLLRLAWRFRSYLRRNWLVIAGGAGAMVGQIVFRILEPWPLKLIFDRVLPVGSAAASTGIDMVDRADPMVVLVLSALALVIFTGLRALMSYWSTITFALAGNRILSLIRSDLFSHMQRLSLAYHTKARRGDLITRVVGDVGRLKEVVVTAALPLTVHALTLGAMLAVMVWLHGGLTLVAVSVFPLLFISFRRKTKEIRTVARKHRKIESALASVAAESLGAIEVVQAYGLEGEFEQTFGRQNRKSVRDGVKAKRLSAGLERKTDVVIAIANGLVLLVGAWLVLRGSLTPGDLLVFVTYLKNAFKPMKDISKYTGRLAQASASAERITDVLDKTPEIEEKSTAREARHLPGEVRFEGVTLSYREGREVLRGIRFDVWAGATVALVGPSGAGKSSIVGLLLRLYDPDEGQILIDGHDIRDFTLPSLRSQVAVVLQESVLFRETIRKNIAFGSPGASGHDVEWAARLANAHDFISRLPEGYDTVVGERGVTLSGGERQRIAIARAAVRGSPIVVLDEPTTGLDRENSRAVLEAINRIGSQRTIIHIAHDLRTVIDADEILYLEEGVIAESGTHQRLIDLSGRYADLFRLQSLSNAREKQSARSA
ncbi:MAG TPA: ABC transporter ATP-binding protein [Acidimicrobiia bacterium]